MLFRMSNESTRTQTAMTFFETNTCLSFTIGGIRTPSPMLLGFNVVRFKLIAKTSVDSLPVLLLACLVARFAPDAVINGSGQKRSTNRDETLLFAGDMEVSTDVSVVRFLAGMGLAKSKFVFPPFVSSNSCVSTWVS